MGRDFSKAWTKTTMAALNDDPTGRSSSVKVSDVSHHLEQLGVHLGRMKSQEGGVRKGGVCNNPQEGTLCGRGQLYVEMLMFC